MQALTSRRRLMASTPPVGAAAAATALPTLCLSNTTLKGIMVNPMFYDKLISSTRWLPRSLDQTPTHTLFTPVGNA